MVPLSHIRCPAIFAQNFRIASKIFERTLGKNKKELLELLENYLKVLELRGDEKEAVLIAKRIKEINQY